MKRVVIKIGTGVLTREDASLNGAALARLVTALADLIDSDLQVVVVSSGAVGAGVSALGLEEYPDDVQSRQAAAAGLRDPTQATRLSDMDSCRQRR